MSSLILISPFLFCCYCFNEKCKLLSMLSKSIVTFSVDTCSCHAQYTKQQSNLHHSHHVGWNRRWNWHHICRMDNLLWNYSLWPCFPLNVNILHIQNSEGTNDSYHSPLSVCCYLNICLCWEYMWIPSCH